MDPIATAVAGLGAGAIFGYLILTAWIKAIERREAAYSQDRQECLATIERIVADHKVEREAWIAEIRALTEERKTNFQTLLNRTTNALESNTAKGEQTAGAIRELTSFTRTVEQLVARATDDDRTGRT